VDGGDVVVFIPAGSGRTRLKFHDGLIATADCNAPRVLVAAALKSGV